MKIHPSWLKFIKVKQLQVGSCNMNWKVTLEQDSAISLKYYDLETVV